MIGDYISLVCAGVFLFAWCIWEVIDRRVQSKRLDRERERERQWQQSLKCLSELNYLDHLEQGFDDERDREPRRTRFELQDSIDKRNGRYLGDL